MGRRIVVLALVLVCSSLAVAQSPSSMPTTAPSTLPAADTSTPKGTLRLLFAATDAGDQAKIKELLFTDSPAEQKMADTMADMSSAVAGLTKAMKDTFGDDQTKALLGDSAAAAAKRDEMVGKLQETITGDTATVQLNSMGGFDPVQFRKVDGQWKLALNAPAQKSNPAAMEQQMEVSSIQAGVIRDVSGDVRAGKFKSVADVKQTLDARVRQAIMEYAQARQKAATSKPAATMPAAPADAPAPGM